MFGAYRNPHSFIFGRSLFYSGRLKVNKNKDISAPLVIAWSGRKSEVVGTWIASTAKILILSQKKGSKVKRMQKIMKKLNSFSCLKWWPMKIYWRFSRKEFISARRSMNIYNRKFITSWSSSMTNDFFFLDRSSRTMKLVKWHLTKSRVSFEEKPASKELLTSF